MSEQTNNEAFLKYLDGYGEGYREASEDMRKALQQMFPGWRVARWHPQQTDDGGYLEFASRKPSWMTTMRQRL